MTSKPTQVTKKEVKSNAIDVDQMNKLLDQIDTSKLPSAKEQLKDV